MARVYRGFALQQEGDPYPWGSKEEAFHVSLIDHILDTPHNSITGLQGGSNTERYHITKAMYDAIVNIQNAELKTNKGIANGYASLDSNGKVPASQLPASSGGSSSVGVVNALNASDGNGGWKAPWGITIDLADNYADDYEPVIRGVNHIGLMSNASANMYINMNDDPSEDGLKVFDGSSKTEVFRFGYHDNGLGNRVRPRFINADQISHPPVNDELITRQWGDYSYFTQDGTTTKSLTWDLTGKTISDHAIVVKKDGINQGTIAGDGILRWLQSIIQTIQSAFVTVGTTFYSIGKSFFGNGLTDYSAIVNVQSASGATGYHVIVVPNTGSLYAGDYTQYTVNSVPQTQNGKPIYKNNDSDNFLFYCSTPNSGYWFMHTSIISNGNTAWTTADYVHLTTGGANPNSYAFQGRNSEISNQATASNLSTATIGVSTPSLAVRDLTSGTVMVANGVNSVIGVSRSGIDTDSDLINFRSWFDTYKFTDSSVYGLYGSTKTIYGSIGESNITTNVVYTGSAGWAQRNGYGGILTITDNTDSNLVAHITSMAGAVAGNSTVGLTTRTHQFYRNGIFTSTGTITCPVSTATMAGLNLGAFGVVPSSPVDGDVYKSGADTLSIRMSTNTRSVAWLESATFNNTAVSIKGTGAYNYNIVGGALATANRTLTLPAITANDTFAVLGLGQAYTGNNSFSGTTTFSNTRGIALTGAGAVTTAGDLAYDTTQKMYVGFATAKCFIQRTLMTQYTLVSVANTTTETSLLSGTKLGSLTLPTPSTGSTYRIILNLQCPTGTEAMTFNLYMGATLIKATAIASATYTNDGATLEYVVVMGSATSVTSTTASFNRSSVAPNITLNASATTVSTYPIDVKIIHGIATVTAVCVSATIEQLS